MKKLATLFALFINAPIQIYSGATFKKGLQNLEDVYNNTVDGDTVIVRQDFDMGAENLKLKPNVKLERVGNPTITSSNAVGTIVAVDSNGDVETGVGTASISGKGIILNSSSMFKKIVGHIDFSEKFIALIHSRLEYSKVTIFKNELGVDIDDINFADMVEGAGNISILFVDDVIEDGWFTAITCVGHNTSAGKTIAAYKQDETSIIINGIETDDYLTLTYERFYNVLSDVTFDYEP